MDNKIKDICNNIIKDLNNANESFRNKTVLITGANGLIGGFLADYFNTLNENGFNVNLILTSKSKFEDAFRVKHLIKKPNISYLSLDLSEDFSLTYFYKNKVDYCFYCAGYAQPSKFLKGAFTTLNLNSHGLQRILKVMHLINPKLKSVFLSSSEIYANNSTEGSHKETSPLLIDLNNKRTPYIIGKISGESIINEFREMGYDTKSIRISLCYGPGVGKDDGRVMSELTRKGIKQDEINLFDDGSATRRYIHISDCCKMMINILLKGEEPVYNVGGNKEITILEMALIIGDYFNKPIKKGPNQNLVSTSAPKKVWVSMDRYIEEFGEINLIPFQEGLVNFIEWYKTKLYEST